MEAQFRESFRAEEVGPLIQKALARLGKSPEELRIAMGWLRQRLDAVVQQHVGPLTRDECEGVAVALGVTLEQLLNGTELRPSPPKDPPGTIRRVPRFQVREELDPHFEVPKSPRPKKALRAAKQGRPVKGREVGLPPLKNSAMDDAVAKAADPEKLPVPKEEWERARANLILFVEKKQPPLRQVHIGHLIGLGGQFFSNLKRGHGNLTRSRIKRLEMGLKLPEGWLTSKEPDLSVLKDLQSSGEDAAPEDGDPEDLPVLREIRERARANLILFVAKHPTICGSHVGPKIGMSPSFFSNLKGDRCLITDPLIKKLEEGLGLPEGWLTSEEPDLSVLEDLQSPEEVAAESNMSPDELFGLLEQHPDIRLAYWGLFEALDALSPDDREGVAQNLLEAVQKTQ